METLKTVTIWADGSCSGNPGVGGYCAILQFKDVRKIVKGSCVSKTTNNRMELTAVLEGLRALKERVIVEVITDSGYVVDAFNKGYINNWRSRNWKTKNGDLVKNRDLWEALYVEYLKHVCTFTWVKGHDSNENNIECDKIAKSMIRGVQNTTTIDYTQKQ